MSRAPGIGMKGRWTWGVAAAVAAVAAMVVVVGWLVPYFGSLYVTGPAGTGVHDAQATTGRADPVPIDADVSPATIREIETITGAVDGHELIGRRVDLRLKATGVTTEGAFWVGPHDNRVLVTPPRDARTARRPVREGEQVTIAGTIQATPNAKERLGWALTAPDLIQLTDQKIYIRADRITP
jgi:hypothetical protein